MAQYKLLTNGDYDGLDNCVGKTVEGFTKKPNGLVYVTCANLMKIGADKEIAHYTSFYTFADGEIELVTKENT